jgi:nucleotide-binding universal stress UspA family protein
VSSWTVLVGFDGSQHGHDALEFGDQLAAATGARLVLGCVYPCHPVTGRLGSGDRARAVLATARLRVTGAWTSRIIPAQSVAAGLAALADDDGADIVVLGSRHRGALGEALPGATAHALLQRGRGLVAVAPHGHRRRDLRRVGVLTDRSAAGRAALAAAQALARQTGASLLVQGPNGAPGTPAAGPRARLAEDLAQGALDLLVAPAWGHGLLGRLRRRGRRRPLARGAACPILVVPAGARLGSRDGRADGGRPDLLQTR